MKKVTEDSITDTIFAPIKHQLAENCKIENEKYFNIYGLSISRFYDVVENISTEDASILLLKPFYTKQAFLNCFPETVDHNLLIIHDKRAKKIRIFNNLLFSDDRNVYQQIKPTITGFQISAEQGSSSKFYSNIFISKNKVDSIKIESWGFVQYKKVYKYENRSLDSFNISIIDSLQNVNNK